MPSPPARLLLVLCTLAASSYQALAFTRRGLREAEVPMPPVTPFYTPLGEFYEMAMRHGTDKVSGHHYDHMYTKWFSTMDKTRRFQPLKMLEIGLGCGMGYGPGHSASLWREYFPNADLWFGEFDKACVDKHMDKLNAMKIRVVTGDQADNDTLHRWLAETGGGFDIIIDDGGHSNMQMFMTATVLFEKALKPGGIFFIEDLQVSRIAVDGDKKHVMIEVLKDWMEGLVMSWFDNRRGYVQELFMPSAVAYLPTFVLPPRVKELDCSDEMCAILKCTDDDKRCSQGLPQGPHPHQNLTHCGRHVHVPSHTMHPFDQLPQQ